MPDLNRIKLSRRYSEEALKQLLFIKQCRALDMTIEEINLVFETRAKPDNSCETVNATIERHIDDIAQRRITELNALRHSLVSIRSTCADNKKVQECGVLHQVDSIAETLTTSKNIM